MGKTAFMFAGQGAQVVGMGRDLASQYPTAAALCSRANAALDYDLTRVCFEGPELDLTRTENAQPGIYLIGWITFQLLRERVPTLTFDATAGLSLGEFTALAAAGVFDFEEGLRLVRARGRFMQEACEATRGGMAAVIGLDEAPTRAVCTEAGVELANLNCPGQLVISGDLERLPRAIELATAAGARKVVPLDVAGAYHSRLMESARTRLEAALEQVPLRPPVVPVLSNVTGEPHGPVETLRARLVEQVTSPVRWEAGVRHLLASGFTHFIELGPGKALTGFIRRIDKSAQVWNVADVASLEETARALSPLASLDPTHLRA